MTTRLIHRRLADGGSVLLRPIRASDEARLKRGIAALSDRSRYLRFFNGAKQLPDHIVAKLADADGRLHIAWGAIDSHTGEVVAAAHAMREDERPEAELAFGVLDAYHGQGLARLLITAVIADCIRQDVTRLAADVLAENRNAKRLLRHFGAICADTDGSVAHYAVDIRDAVARIRAMERPEGVADLLDALLSAPIRAA